MTGPISGKSTLRFRKAIAADLDRILEIHLAAYPDARAYAVRKRLLTHHPFGSLDRLIVAEHEGALVAHAFLFRLQAYFGGVSVKVGGIASVGVAPEARGRGIATALMSELHRRASANGDAVTMLYAFRHGFYSRLGYANTSSRRRLAIDTRAIPASWRELAKTHVRALRPSDALPKLHERAARAASGWVARPPRHWEHLLEDERRFTFVCRDRGGYCAFRIGQTEAHGETVIEVDEIVALDGRSRRALFGALAALGDQASEIVVELAADDPLEHALVDADGRRFGTESVEHELGAIVAGPMIRLVDVRRAIEARGYPTDGAFELELTDVPIAARVRIGKGRARFTKAAQPKRPFRTTRAGLAAILYGGLAPSAAVALDLAEGHPPDDALVRLPPLSPIDAF